MSFQPRNPASLHRRKKEEKAPFHERRRGNSQASELLPEKPALFSAQRSLKAGMSLLMCLALGLLTVAGIAEVRARAEILERSEQLTQLSAEHSKLADEKRRLEAERAFLRHPEHVAQVATERSHMFPADPARIRQIYVDPAKSGTMQKNWLQQWVQLGSESHE